MKIKSPKKTGNVEGDAESRKKEERGETKKGMNKLVVVVVVVVVGGGTRQIINVNLGKRTGAI